MAIPQVLIVPANPMDIRPEELEPLVEALRTDSHLTVDVGIVPQRGYGVTWWEVVAMYIATKGTDAVVGDLLDTLLETIKDRARAWYKKRREAGGPKGKRPLALDVRDEEGNVLLGLEFKPDGEVKDVTEERRTRPVRPRPESADDEEDDAEDA